MPAALSNTVSARAYRGGTFCAQRASIDGEGDKGLIISRSRKRNASWYPCKVDAPQNMPLNKRIAPQIVGAVIKANEAVRVGEREMARRPDDDSITCAGAKVKRDHHQFISLHVLSPARCGVSLSCAIISIKKFLSLRYY